MSVSYGVGWSEVSPGFRPYNGPVELPRPSPWPTPRPPTGFEMSNVSGRDRDPQTGERILDRVPDASGRHFLETSIMLRTSRVAETYEAHQRTILNLLRRGEQRTVTYGSLLFRENVVRTDDPVVLQRTFEQVKRLVEFALENPAPGVNDVYARRFYVWNNMDGWEQGKVVRMAVQTTRVDVLRLLITYQGVYFRDLEPFDMQQFDGGPIANVDDDNHFRPLIFRLNRDPISYLLFFNGRYGGLTTEAVYQTLQLLAESSNRRVGCPVDDFYHQDPPEGVVTADDTLIRRPMNMIFEAWSRDPDGDVAAYVRLIELLVRLGARRSAVSVFVFDFEQLYSPENHKQIHDVWYCSSFRFRGLVTDLRAWQDTNIPARVALWFQQEPADTALLAHVEFADWRPVRNRATGSLGHTQPFLCGEYRFVLHARSLDGVLSVMLECTHLPEQDTPWGIGRFCIVHATVTFGQTVVTIKHRLEASLSSEWYEVGRSSRFRRPFQLKIDIARVPGDGRTNLTGKLWEEVLQGAGVKLASVRQAASLAYDKQADIVQKAADRAIAWNMLTWMYRSYAPLSYFRAYSVLDDDVTTRAIGLALAAGLMDARGEETQLWVCHKFGMGDTALPPKTAERKLSAVLRTLFEHAYRTGGDQRVVLAPFFCAWVFMSNSIFPHAPVQHLHLDRREPLEDLLGVLRDYTDFFEKRDSLVHVLNSYAHEHPDVVEHFTALYFAPGNESARELLDSVVRESVKERLTGYDDPTTYEMPSAATLAALAYTPLETSEQLLARVQASHRLLLALDVRLDGGDANEGMSE